ncbi:uncharacterized protein [Ambystoma mexicanum]|uniref:uncharacterized protein isoform X2 n=1 Tax=Ambystoma mexicanum TaxID=8296 RepID=UPI0037E79AFA
MKNRGKMSVRAEVVFREVAAHFSEADWKLLDEEQKKSYIDVMKDVHQYLVSLAPRTVTPDILLVIKKEEEAYDWKPCSSVKSELENTAASPVITSVFSIKEEPSPLDVDAEESRINQEKTNARDCNVKRIHVGNHEMDIEMATGRGMAEIKRRTEHETARSEGASKSLIPRNTLEMLKTGSTQKPVAGISSPADQECLDNLHLQEERPAADQSDKDNQHGEDMPPENMEEQSLEECKLPSGKRKPTSYCEGESLILQKKKPVIVRKTTYISETGEAEGPHLESDKWNTSQSNSWQLGASQEEVPPCSSPLHDMTLVPNIDPTNLFANSLSSHMWNNTLEEISGTSSMSTSFHEWPSTLGGLEGGRGTGAFSKNVWNSTLEEIAGSSSGSVSYCTAWRNTLDKGTDGSNGTKLGLNACRSTLEEEAVGISAIVPGQSFLESTLDKSAGSRCGNAHRVEKEKTSSKNIANSDEFRLGCDTKIQMDQPDTGIRDFLSDLNQEQRQTIRSFMRVLLNVIDQEPILPQFISPLLPPQLHSPQLLPVQPHPIQPLPVQTNSIHLNSIKLPVPPPSVQPNTVQLRCLPPHSVLSQSFHPKSKQLQTVQPHSVQLQSLPSHSLQPRSVQPQYIRPLSNQTQSIQPHSGQAHSIQLHAAKQQSASPLSVLPQCFLPQSALSPAICKTSYLQGSTTALKAPLIVDPTLPERFASVTVDKQHLRRLLMAADGRVKKHAAFLLNGLIKLLFKKEELARSDGLGLRGKKSNSLDQVKVDAMREFLHSKCLERKWNHLDGNRFTRIITNKISNARRDLKQGNKCHLDSKAKPQAAYRSEKMLHCSSSGAGPATPPLQALSCNQGKAERTLSKGDSF